MCWRKQAKIRSLLLQFLPQKRRIPTSVYIRFWGNQTKLIEELKQLAPYPPLSSGLSLWDKYPAPPRCGKCPIACEATAPHLSLELPTGSGSSPALSGWLQPGSLKFCPSAISYCTQLVIHESVSCSCHHLSQQAFEAMLATPGKRTRVE